MDFWKGKIIIELKINGGCCWHVHGFKKFRWNWDFCEFGITSNGGVFLCELENEKAKTTVNFSQFYHLQNEAFIWGINHGESWIPKIISQQGVLLIVFPAEVTWNSLCIKSALLARVRENKLLSISQKKDSQIMLSNQVLSHQKEDKRKNKSIRPTKMIPLPYPVVPRSTI